MRPLFLILLLAACANFAHAAEPPAAPNWPLWDGAESVEQYAKRAGLEPTKTLDLGNGVKMEMVLIPAGRFVMGTEEPEPVDEAGYQKKIIFGQAALALGGLALLAMIGVVAVRAIRRKARPQFSLAYLLVMTVVAGVGVLGGMHWWESARLWAETKAEYPGALARYNVADASEKPAHEVTLTKPLHLGKFKVTQDQYQQVMGTNPSFLKGNDLPVEEVSWEEAHEFCKKASDRTGLLVRLPMEAEWEHACRAGTRTTYNLGDAEADLDRAAWYCKNSNSTTQPVGQKAPNAWALFDMHGNVCEWCEDLCGFYKSDTRVDRYLRPLKEYRVVRGGSINEHPETCRSAQRGGCAPNGRNFNIGFRPAAAVPPKAR